MTISRHPMFTLSSAGTLAAQTPAVLRRIHLEVLKSEGRQSLKVVMVLVQASFGWKVEFMWQAVNTSLHSNRYVHINGITDLCSCVCVVCVFACARMRDEKRMKR